MTSEVRTAGDTVMYIATPVTDPETATMLVKPTPTPVASPAELIVAMVG